MKAFATIILIVLIIFIPTAAGKYADGYYFNFEYVAVHYTEHFPAFPDFADMNFFSAAGALFNWIFDFAGWLFAPDPWTKQKPAYRG